MRKRINGNKNNLNKKITSICIVLVFLFYICLSLVTSNRKYLYIESFFKNISSSINTFFVDNTYSCDNLSNKIISAKLKYLEKENNNLKDALQIKEDNTDYVFSKVINHTSKTWFDKVDINKGYNDKISNNLPVISSNGLIGFISKTSKNTSEVRLLTNINKDSLLSVLIETDEGVVAGVLSDYNVNKKLFKITDVTDKKNILPGNLVTLSGYDNELCKGIYVGKVVKEEKENYGLSRTIWVKSDVNFDDLMFVFVPVYKEEK